MADNGDSVSGRNKYAMMIPILHGQFISALISGAGFFTALLADRNANCPMFLSLLTYMLLALHLFALQSKDANAAHDNNGYIDLDDDNNVIADLLTIDNYCAEDSSSQPMPSELRTDCTSREKKSSKYEMHCPWYLYFLMALLDLEANVIVISAYNYTSITSIMLLDCFSIPCVMMISFCFLGARYRTQHIVGVVICLMGMGCIILSDSSSVDDMGSDSGDDSDDGPSSKNAVKGDILCLIGTSLYALSNVLQEAMVKTKDRIEYLGMLGLFGTLISVVQTSIFERDKLLHDVEWGVATISFTAGVVLCLFFMYRNTSAFLKTSDAALFNLSLLTSDVYAVVFSYFVFGYTASWLYFVALVLAVAGVLLYHTAGPVHDNVEAAVERFRAVMLRGVKSYSDYRDHYKYIHQRKDSDGRKSFRSIHNMDNYDCIVDECTGAVTNSTITVDNCKHDENPY
jgi:solute carrier family 35, member F1/2